jgi:hypothetical protein
MMNSNLPPHPFVFFSYPSEGQTLVVRLKSDLQSYGINIWTDQNLRVGMNFHEADYDRVMALFEELEPHYSKTNQILADL